MAIQGTLLEGGVDDGAGDGDRHLVASEIAQVGGTHNLCIKFESFALLAVLNLLIHMVGVRVVAQQLRDKRVADSGVDDGLVSGRIIDSDIESDGFIELDLAAGVVVVADSHERSGSRRIHYENGSIDGVALDSGIEGRSRNSDRVSTVRELQGRGIDRDSLREGVRHGGLLEFFPLVVAEDLHESLDSLVALIVLELEHVDRGATGSSEEHSVLTHVEHLNRIDGDCKILGGDGDVFLTGVAALVGGHDGKVALTGSLEVRSEVDVEREVLHGNGGSLVDVGGPEQ